jgi:hypothetical protein
MRHTRSVVAFATAAVAPPAPSEYGPIGTNWIVPSGIAFSSLSSAVTSGGAAVEGIPALVNTCSTFFAGCISLIDTSHCILASRAFASSMAVVEAEAAAPDEPEDAINCRIFTIIRLWGATTSF